LIVSEAITRSALERRESRGAQFRNDYPKPDPAFAGLNVSVRLGDDGDMKVSRVPIPPLPSSLAEVVEEMK
jgi:succinate dehydrogenase / fumarate reductase flavoprotein subunit